MPGPWRVETETVNDLHFGGMKSVVIYEGDEQLCYFGYSEDAAAAACRLVDAANGKAMSDNDMVPIPRDPDARRRLAEFAGLTDEERRAIDRWCFEEEQKRARGVLLRDDEDHR